MAAFRTLGEIQRQANAMDTQTSLIQQQMNAGKEAIAASKASADAAKATAEAAIDSNEITKATAELARQSLVLTHRPRLIIRNVVVPDFVTIPSAFPIRIRGELRITNVGTGPAQVVSAVAEVVISGAWPNQPIMPRVEHDAEIVFSLAPGVYKTRSFQSDRDIDRGEYDRIFNGMPAIYIQGYIGYSDDMGNFRSTSFCRWWYNRRFVPPEHDNGDLENAD
jgi:hypothetical protein